MDLAGARIIRSKKGVIFTIMAIVIAVFFTVVFSARLEKPIDYKTDITETRIKVLNDYDKNFYDYAKGAASISGYAALQGVIIDLNSMKRYYDLSPNEFESNYTYCIRTGNLTDSKICPNMINKTLIYFLDKIQNISEDELNIQSNYAVNSINITQATSNFAIELLINLSLKIDDFYANISDTRIVKSSVSIVGLLDPVYMLNGTYNQTINSTKPDNYGNWTPADLRDLYYAHAYRSNKDAISFINRIKGNFSSNDYGIESFVNLTGPGVLSRMNENSSLVDYLFWQNMSSWNNVIFKCKPPNATIVEINNTAIVAPLGFQLDEIHRVSFNISKSDTNYTCT
jgi:hypothetical protein